MRALAEQAKAKAAKTQAEADDKAADVAIKLLEVQKLEAKYAAAAAEQQVRQQEAINALEAAKIEGQTALLVAQSELAQAQHENELLVARLEKEMEFFKTELENSADEALKEEQLRHVEVLADAVNTKYGDYVKAQGNYLKVYQNYLNSIDPAYTGKINLLANANSEDEEWVNTTNFYNSMQAWQETLATVADELSEYSDEIEYCDRLIAQYNAELEELAKGFADRQEYVDETIEIADQIKANTKAKDAIAYEQKKENEATVTYYIADVYKYCDKKTSDVNYFIEEGKLYKAEGTSVKECKIEDAMLTVDPTDAGITFADQQCVELVSFTVKQYEAKGVDAFQAVADYEKAVTEFVKGDLATKMKEATTAFNEAYTKKQEAIKAYGNDKKTFFDENGYVAKWQAVYAFYNSEAVEYWPKDFKITNEANKLSLKKAVNNLLKYSVDKFISYGADVIEINQNAAAINKYMMIYLNGRALNAGSINSYLTQLNSSDPVQIKSALSSFYNIFADYLKDRQGKATESAKNLKVSYFFREKDGLRNKKGEYTTYPIDCYWAATDNAGFAINKTENGDSYTERYQMTGVSEYYNLYEVDEYGTNPILQIAAAVLADSVDVATTKVSGELTFSQLNLKNQIFQTAKKNLGLAANKLVVKKEDNWYAIDVTAEDSTIYVATVQQVEDLAATLGTDPGKPEGDDIVLAGSEYQIKQDGTLLTCESLSKEEIAKYNVVNNRLKEHNTILQNIRKKISEYNAEHEVLRQAINNVADAYNKQKGSKLVALKAEKEKAETAYKDAQKAYAKVVVEMNTLLEKGESADKANSIKAIVDLCALAKTSNDLEKENGILQNKYTFYMGLVKEIKGVSDKGEDGKYALTLTSSLTKPEGLTGTLATEVKFDTLEEYLAALLEKKTVEIQDNIAKAEDVKDKLEAEKAITESYFETISTTEPNFKLIAEKTAEYNLSRLEQAQVQVNLAKANYEAALAIYQSELFGKATE